MNENENVKREPVIEIDSLDDDTHASGSDRQHQIMPAIASAIIAISIFV